MSWLRIENWKWQKGLTLGIKECQSVSTFHLETQRNEYGMKLISHEIQDPISIPYFSDQLNSYHDDEWLDRLMEPVLNKDVY